MRNGALLRLNFRTHALVRNRSEEDAEERPRKPVPAWARSEALGPVLQAQIRTDPDTIFGNPSKTCDLADVFGCVGSDKRPFSRRGSSGRWDEDAVTRREEEAFRRRMGYIPREATPHSGSAHGSGQ